MGDYKKKCCKRFLRKPTACGKCPLIAPLPKSKQKKAIRKLRKQAKRS